MKRKNLPYTYAILGAGLQGAAAAYDLAQHGDASEIRIGDVAILAAEELDRKLFELTEKDIFENFEADANDPSSLARFLKDVDVCLSCVPYHLHPKVADAAIAAGCSLVDMGGDTDEALATLARDEEAKDANVSIVTDGGVAPGLINLLAAHLIGDFDEPQSAQLYCGGLPLAPKPPFNYKLAFNIEGLISEYADKAFAIRKGEVVEVAPLDDIEEIEWQNLGVMEACTTSGGVGTAPWIFAGKVERYEYKTLRFPGHWEKMKLFRDLGFWGTEPIEIEGAIVKPRMLFEKLVGDFLLDPDPKDQLLLRVQVSGLRQGNHESQSINMREIYEEETGFTAMQRMTGFPVSICAIEIANGNVKKGCTPFELSMLGTTMIDGLAKRSILVHRSTE